MVEAAKTCRHTYATISIALDWLTGCITCLCETEELQSPFYGQEGIATLKGTGRILTSLQILTRPATEAMPLMCMWDRTTSCG